MQFEHPVVDRKDWMSFCRNLNPYFARAIGREQTDVPYWCCPLAWGVIVAGPALFIRTRYSGPPFGWRQLSDSVYHREFSKARLRVRRTNGGGLWLISRWPDGVSMRTDRDSETLVHQFGHTPLVADDPLAAMHLAEWFQFHDGVSGLRWAKASLALHSLCRAIAVADQRARNVGLTFSWNDLWASSSHSRRMKRGGTRYRNGKLLPPVIVGAALHPDAQA
jgi:hypothetical protein